MLRRSVELAGLSILLLGWACGGDDDDESSTPPAPTIEEAPLEPEPETGPPEERIAYGIATEERVFVRFEPREDSRAIGIIRNGARFEISETREVGSQTWHRYKDVGWLLAGDVSTRTAAPPTRGFIPVAPRLENAMPYRIARVRAEEGVPVYRRPPRRGEDPERVRMRNLEQGYFFTIDKYVNIYDRRMYRGTRYWFIPREGTTPVRAPEFEGIEVTEETQIPFLWVTDPTGRVCQAPRRPGEENATRCEPVERHERLPMIGQRDEAGTWYQTSEEGWIASLQVARVDRVESRPEPVAEGEHWIYVNLRNQYAALYAGDTMKFVTLISSGDEEHDTPTGIFRVESKHVTATMDDEENMSSAYFIQDVPWVLYFRGSYALHGAFWHNRFGLRTSHGCINLAPRDAKRFFEFAMGPELVEGFHAVFTPPYQRGTLIWIDG